MGEARIGCGAVARVRVHGGQDAELLACRQLIMDKIPLRRMCAFAYRATHRPDTVRPNRILAIFLQLRLLPPFRVLVSQLESQLIVNPASLFHVDRPTFPAQQHVHAPIPIAHTRFADLLYPSFAG